MLFIDQFSCQLVDLINVRFINEKLLINKRSTSKGASSLVLYFLKVAEFFNDSFTVF